MTLFSFFPPIIDKWYNRCFKLGKRTHFNDNIIKVYTLYLTSASTVWNERNSIWLTFLSNYFTPRPQLRPLNPCIYSQPCTSCLLYYTWSVAFLYSSPSESLLQILSTFFLIKATAEDFKVADYGFFPPPKQLRKVLEASYFLNILGLSFECKKRKLSCFNGISKSIFWPKILGHFSLSWKQRHLKERTFKSQWN